jgi:hypothetical protein
MAGAQSANPLGRNPFATNVQSNSTTGSFASASPFGADADEPTELDTKMTISDVKKDWADPPVVTPVFDPVVSGNSLKAVLENLKKIPKSHEWGKGGGSIRPILKRSDDKKSYIVELKGTFDLKLVKWTDYEKMTEAQKGSWDNMIANLTVHEQEHVYIAYRGAEELVMNLKGLDIAAANRLIAANVAETKRKQTEFDSPAQTDHGFKDYSAFPQIVLDTSADPP